MSKGEFDAKRICGERRCKQWGEIVKLCESCTDKIKIDMDTFNLFAIDGPTIQPEWGYTGIYSKQMNHFIEPHNDIDLSRCNEESKQPGQASQKYSGCYSKVVYIDLAAFKAVNTCFGEKMGDALIAYTANYIRDCFKDNCFMVSRKGGDEFNVFYMNQPRCVNFDKFENVRSDHGSFFDFVYESAFASFAKQEVVLCFPKDNSPRSYIAVPFENFKDLVSNKESYKESFYTFGLVIKKLFFHFGVGNTPDEAYDNRGMEHVKGLSFKERNNGRGEFIEETSICLINCQDGKEEEISLYNHLFLLTHDQNVLKKLFTIISEFAQDYPEIKLIGKEYRNRDVPGIPKTFFIVMKFNPDPSDNISYIPPRREELLEKICKFVWNSLSSQGTRKIPERIFSLSNKSIKKISEVSSS